MKTRATHIAYAFSIIKNDQRANNLEIYRIQANQFKLGEEWFGLALFRITCEEGESKMAENCVT